MKALFSLFYRLSIVFLMVNISLCGQTKEDVASLRQETLRSMQQDNHGYQKFIDYYNNISVTEMLVLKIKSQLIREDYSNAVTNLFQLKKMVEDSKNPRILFQYYWMSYQINQILGIKSEADENVKQLKQLYPKIDKIIPVELSVDFSAIHFFSEKEKISLLKQVIKQCLLEKNYFLAARIYYYLGNIYLAKGNIRLAKHYFLESNKIGLKTDQSASFKMYIKCGLAKVYLYQKKYTEAYNELLPLKGIVASTPDISLQNQYYTNLAVASAYNSISEEVKWADSRLADSKQITEDSKIKGRALLASKLESDYAQQIENQKRFWNYLFFALFIFFVLIIIGFFIFFRLKFKNSVEIKQETELKIFNIPDKTEKELLLKLNLFELSGKYTKKNISLKTLSQQLETNPRYLSEVINKHKNTNFNTYINELRIDYIIKKLKEDSDYRKYKVSYLAEESGFSSHSLFTTVFKNKLGVAPIDYIQKLEKD